MAGLLDNQILSSESSGERGESEILGGMNHHSNNFQAVSESAVPGRMGMTPRNRQPYRRIVTSHLQSSVMHMGLTDRVHSSTPCMGYYMSGAEY